SMGALLCLGLVVLALLAWRKAWKSMAVILLLGLAAASWIIWQRNAYSWHLAAFTTKQELLGAAWQLFLKHPLLGSGLGSFGEAYQQAGFNLDTGAKYAHNLLLQLLVETGLTGTLLFGIALVSLLSRFKRPSRWEGWGVMAGVFAFGLFSLVDLPFQ